MEIQQYEICNPMTPSQARFAPCTPPKCLVECGPHICAHVLNGKVKLIINFRKTIFILDRKNRIKNF